jgi:hypothetical protein
VHQDPHQDSLLRPGLIGRYSRAFDDSVPQSHRKTGVRQRTLAARRTRVPRTWSVRGRSLSVLLPFSSHPDDLVPHTTTPATLTVPPKPVCNRELWRRGAPGPRERGASGDGGREARRRVEGRAADAPPARPRGPPRPRRHGLQVARSVQGIPGGFCSGRVGGWATLRREYPGKNMMVFVQKYWAIPAFRVVHLASYPPREPALSLQARKENLGVWALVGLTGILLRRGRCGATSPTGTSSEDRRGRALGRPFARRRYLSPGHSQVARCHTGSVSQYAG